MTGFNFFLKNKDYFAVTNRTRKTEKLASKILQKMGFPTEKPEINYMLMLLEKANLERVTLPSGVKYWKVCGKGFCSTFFDGDIVIFEL